MVIRRFLRHAVILSALGYLAFLVAHYALGLSERAAGLVVVFIMCLYMSIVSDQRPREDGR